MESGRGVDLSIVLLRILATCAVERRAEGGGFRHVCCRFSASDSPVSVKHRYEAATRPPGALPHWHRQLSADRRWAVDRPSSSLFCYMQLAAYNSRVARSPNKRHAWHYYTTALPHALCASHSRLDQRRKAPAPNLVTSTQSIPPLGPPSRPSGSAAALPQSPAHAQGK